MGALASIKWTWGVDLRRVAYAHQDYRANEDKSCSSKEIETLLVDELRENGASDDYMTVTTISAADTPKI